MVSQKDAEEARDEILSDQNTEDAVKSALLIVLQGLSLDDVEVTSVSATELPAERRLQENEARGLLNVSYAAAVPSSDTDLLANIRGTDWSTANVSFATYLWQVPAFTDKLITVQYTPVKEGEVLSNGVVVVEPTTSAAPTLPSTTPGSLTNDGDDNAAASASLIGGIILAVLLACLAVFLCIWMWKRRQEPKEEHRDDNGPVPEGEPGLAVVSPANQADLIEASSDDEARPVQDHIVGQNASVMQYSV